MHVLNPKFAMYSTPKAGQENQDTAFYDDEAFSFGVFDGMGGHEDGEVASRLARDAAIPVLGEPSTSTVDALAKIMTALQAGNSSVCDYNWPIGSHGTNNKKSGTTALLGQFVTRDKNYIDLCLGWAGDCRGYLFRRGKLEHLTIDDTISAYCGGSKAKDAYKQKMQNQVTCSNWTSSDIDEQIKYFYNRHRILTYLGEASKKTLDGWKHHPEVELEFGNGTPRVCCSVRPGDMLLFCSDGISDNLVDADIAKLLSSADVEYAAQNLLRLGKQIASQPIEVNPRAKDDDMTALVIKV